MKRPTMQDIAERLQISKNSVSIALSGKQGVSEDLRNRIYKVAEEIGYSLNKNSKTFSNLSDHQIGLIARDEVFSENAFFGVIHLNLGKEIKERGGQLLLHSVDKQSEKEGVIPDFVKEGSVDGVIVLSHLDKTYIQSIVDTDIPMIVIDHHHPELQVDTVLTDNRKGAFEATQTLIQPGDNHVGFIGEVHKSPSYRERYEGYLDVLRELDLIMNPDWINHEIYEDENMVKEYLLRLKEMPQGWFVANDHFGFLLTRILPDLGYRVPEDITICGFDDSYFASLSAPKLTTIAINKEYFAKRSVEQLYRRLEDPSLPIEKISLAPHLVTRNSTNSIR